jgi:dethiobiotin synthetase
VLSYFRAFVIFSPGLSIDPDFNEGNGLSAMPGIYITSVGTGIGKTLVTAILCYQLTSAGRTVRALKPVVSGFSPDDPFSDPALILRSLGQVPTPQEIAAIAPWRFTAPISPHLAARMEGCTIRIDDVAAFCRDQVAENNGLLLIEGAGGVMAPINNAHTGVDLIARLGHPVILVTGSYLGAISHTLTALAALRGHQIVIRGIVVSESDQSVGLSATVESLGQFAGDDVPLYALPRLAGSDEEKWCAAPSLMAICAKEHV